jgi:hypothetical protein
MRLTTRYVMAAFAAALLTCSASAQNILINGNLDIGVAGAAGAPGSAVGWTLNNPTHPTGAQFQGGFADNTGVNGVWYRAFLGGAAGPGVDAELTQTVLAPEAGDYLLTFDAVVEQRFTAQSITAALNGVTRDLTLDRIDAGSTYTGGGFGTIGAAVPPHNTQISLLLTGVNLGDPLTVSVAMVQGLSGGGNPQSVVVDNFSLVRIPEPATALLACLAGLGLVVRRRR